MKIIDIERDFSILFYFAFSVVHLDGVRHCALARMILTNVIKIGFCTNLRQEEKYQYWKKYNINECLAWWKTLIVYDL